MWIIKIQMPNGLRYPRVGGTRERHFDGTSFEPRKPSENAATPTRRVHAVLGRLCSLDILWFEKPLRQQILYSILMWSGYVHNDPVERKPRTYNL